MRLRLTAALAAAVSCLAACGGGSAIREVEQGLSTATTIGRTLSLGLEAVGGSGSSCVQVVKACSAFPCDGEATLTLGEGCPLVTGAATGTVSVTGRWTSATKAELTATFTDVKVGEETASAVASVKKVSVEKAGNIITVEYSGSDAVASAAAESAAAVGASNQWSLTIDTKGTGDAADDVLTVEATSALASATAGTAAKTVKIKDVVFEPSCRKNPTSGTAQITEVTTFVPRITEIEFGTACDGTAKVNGASTTLNFFL